MIHLIDGYNVTMNAPETRDLAKEAQRDALIARLASAGKAVLGAGDIVVVFDARDALGPSSEASGSVKVVYAPDADSEIVRRAGGTSQVCVVTADMRLRARLSQDVGRHVRFRDPADLFARAGTSGAPTRDADCLPHQVQRDITAELEGLWLEEDEG